MRISELKEKSKGIDDKILALIDLKIEDDMKQVITQLQSTDKHLQSMEKSIEKRFDMMIWVVGIAFIAIAITILALK